MSEFESARDESLFELMEPRLEVMDTFESRDIELSFETSDKRLSQLVRWVLRRFTFSDSESVVLKFCNVNERNGDAIQTMTPENRMKG